ncbi:pin domain-like protein [Malassezia pachydermatis]|uniref:Pin domain-like protein n=1 Tax=Malassezia pachydermatis TaxID=77020 RepID=A0A0M8MMR2_9BASI|nr:pin domain-like protein [Malassezia pachydermatis]KOS14688.1 pin domain-like protein [Malassezia pachydermatis]
MQATHVVYGIKGVLPFLRRTAPSCFQPLSLPDLRHARIAIDATLLTQRLFYRDQNDPSRHLSGFLQVIHTLRQHNCTPIMVFDHVDARLPQKAREHAKRRITNQRAQFRYKVETARHARLQALLTCVDAYDGMSMHAKHDVRHLLQQWVAKAEGEVDLWSTVPLDAKTWDYMSTVPLPTFDEETTVPMVWTPNDTNDDASVLYDDAHCDESTWADPLAYDWVDEPCIWSSDASTTGSFAITPASLAHAMYALQADQKMYQDHAVYTESASQIPLTYAEKDMYQTLWKGPTDAHGHHLDMIAYACSQSERLVHMYRRSSRLAPKQAYKDCMELCHWLQVPTLVTGDGTSQGGALHEAEAVASALVHHGFADMVASEDSDVLLYQVPLLRGLSSFTLELLDTQQARETLFPCGDAKQSYQYLLEFALLCGTDFNRTVPGIAARGAYRWISHYGTIRALLRAETGRFRPPDMLTREAYEAELDEARAVFAQKPDVRVTALSLGLTQAQPTPDSLHTQTEVPKWAAFLNRTVSFPEATSLTPLSMDRKGLVAFLQAHQVHITAPWRETYEVPDISAQPSALVEPTWATTSLAAHAAAQKE